MARAGAQGLARSGLRYQPGPTNLAAARGFDGTDGMEGASISVRQRLLRPFFPSPILNAAALYVLQTPLLKPLIIPSTSGHEPHYHLLRDHHNKHSAYHTPNSRSHAVQYDVIPKNSRRPTTAPCGSRHAAAYLVALGE